MADLGITAAQVQPATSAATFETLIAGEAVDAGEVCYKKSSDGKAYLADANGTSEVATVRGIAVNDAAAGQKLTLQKSGTLTLGAAAAPTVGEIYLLSVTAGKIAPEGDVTTSDDYLSLIGIASSVTELDLDFNNSGLQIP